MSRPAKRQRVPSRREAVKKISHQIAYTQAMRVHTEPLPGAYHKTFLSMLDHALAKEPASIRKGINYAFDVMLAGLQRDFIDHEGDVTVLMRDIVQRCGVVRVLPPIVCAYEAGALGPNVNIRAIFAGEWPEFDWNMPLRASAAIILRLVTQHKLVVTPSLLRMILNHSVTENEFDGNRITWLALRVLAHTDDDGCNVEILKAEATLHFTHGALLRRTRADEKGGTFLSEAFHGMCNTRRNISWESEGPALEAYLAYRNTLQRVRNYHLTLPLEIRCVIRECLPRELIALVCSYLGAP